MQRGKKENNDTKRDRRKIQIKNQSQNNRQINTNNPRN